MKNLILITFMMPAVAMAQSQADYESVMAKFVKYYNKGDAQKIITLFNEESQDFAKRVFKQDDFNKIHTEDGEMLSFKYIGEDGSDPQLIKVYQVKSTKGTYAMSFSLGTDGKFRTFRQKTSSDHIEQLLRNAD